MTNLEESLSEGGVLITLGGGSQLALDGGLVRDVSRGPGGVFTPGVEVRAKFARLDHPIAYGYSEVTSAFRSNFPVYNVSVADRGLVVLQWETKLPSEEREEKPGQTEGEKKPDAGPCLFPAGCAAKIRSKDDPPFWIFRQVPAECWPTTSTRCIAT